MDADRLPDTPPADAPLVDGSRKSGLPAILDLVDETTAQETAGVTTAGPSATLLDLEESGRLRTRWNEIQGQFVDETPLCGPDWRMRWCRR
jgi:hypothetical protein